MGKKHRSFSERTYKANVMPGGATYKISPMTMIIDQMKKDSQATGITPDKQNDESTEHEDPDDLVMLGPVTSGGLTYKVSHLAEEKNELKNSFNTDVARERGLVKESEDWGTISEDSDD